MQFGYLENISYFLSRALSQFCYWKYLSYFLSRARETYHSFAIGSISATVLSTQSQGDLSQFCYWECLSYFIYRARETYKYHSFAIGSVSATFYPELGRLIIVLKLHSGLRLRSSLFALSYFLFRTRASQWNQNVQSRNSKSSVNELKMSIQQEGATKS